MTDSKLYPLVHAAPTDGTRTLPCCGRFDNDAYHEDHGDTVTSDPAAVTCRPDTHHRTGEKYVYTQAELWEMATERFGEDPRNWAFECFVCHDIATPADFLALGAKIGDCGQECIGRAVKKCAGLAAMGQDSQGLPWAARGCDAVAYGLIPGPWRITMPPGQDTAGPDFIRSFRLARASAATPADQ